MNRPTPGVPISLSPAAVAEPAPSAPLSSSSTPLQSQKREGGVITQTEPSPADESHSCEKKFVREKTFNGHTVEELADVCANASEDPRVPEWELAAIAVAELVEPRWILIGESLPKPGQQVSIILENEERGWGYYRPSTGIWDVVTQSYQGRDGWSRTDITHWLPLPEIPQKNCPEIAP